MFTLVSCSEKRLIIFTPSHFTVSLEQTPQCVHKLQKHL
jgi:hypothetical protein